MGDQEKYPVSLICKDFFKFHWRGLFTFILPIVLSPILIISFDKEWRTLYLIFLLAGFWITQSIPFWISGLIPVVYIPCMGVMDSEDVCKQYLREPIMHVFLGYLVILSLELSKLNRRCALKILATVGNKPRVLHYLLMFFTMCISMVISNTVTTALMCPIIWVILEEFQKNSVFQTEMEEDAEPLNDEGDKHPSLISMAYYLGVAYASNIGGCVTKMGSASNYLLSEAYKKLDIEDLDATKYTHWNILPVFIVFLFIVIIIQVTHMGFLRKKSKEYQELYSASSNAETLKNDFFKSHQELGVITVHERIVAVIIVLTFLLLIFLRPDYFLGYGDILNEKLILASSPLVLSALLMFALPINCFCFKHCFGKHPFPETEIPSTMTWLFLNKKFPWGLLFLLGANFVVLEAIEKSRLLEVFKTDIDIFNETSNSGAQFLMILIAMLFTNIFTNTTIAAISVPICGALAKLHKVHPIYFVMPVGVAASHAFHLKCSTPPNLIATTYGKIRTKYLLLAGIGPSISSLLILFLMGQTWQKTVFPNSNIPP